MTPANRILDRWAASTAEAANDIRLKIERLPTHSSPAPWRYEQAKAVRDTVAAIREQVLAAEAEQVLELTGRIVR